MFTSITPLPATIQRETVLSFIHDHEQMITLNPLVIRFKRTLAPTTASLEEQESCKWYEMTDEISYLPYGVMKGEVSYKGGFYDLPDGLQTHVFAPAGVDLRGLWKIGGNLPGEPRASSELGLDVPRDCLYLREDVDLRCNILLSSFVKRNLKKSHAVLVKTLIEKADEIGERLKLNGGLGISNSGMDHLRTTPSQTFDPISSASRASTYPSPNHTTRSSWQPRSQSKPYVARCTCTHGARGTHEYGCPRYTRNSYITPGVPRRAEEYHSEPGASHTQVAQRSNKSEVVEPSLLRARSDASSDYSPIGQHPCFCDGGVHVTTCAEHPGPVLPRKAQKSMQSDREGSILTVDITTVAGSSVPHSHACESSARPTQETSSGSPPEHDDEGNGISTWFSPQLYGQQAELPTNDWPSPGLRPHPLIPKSSVNSIPPNLTSSPAAPRR